MTSSTYSQKWASIGSQLLKLAETCNKACTFPSLKCGRPSTTQSMSCSELFTVATSSLRLTDSTPMLSRTGGSTQEERQLSLGLLGDSHLLVIPYIRTLE